MAKALVRVRRTTVSAEMARLGICITGMSLRPGSKPQALDGLSK